MLRMIFFIAVILIVQNAYACKIVPSIVDFKVTNQTSVPPPVQPSFKIMGIHRGHKPTDFPRTSCSWLVAQGSISFQLKSLPKSMQGYIFEIIGGKLGDNSIFRKSPVILSNYANSKDIYSFRWADYPKTYREPVRLKIKVTAVSLSGERSEPQYLNISTKQKKKASFFSQIIN